MLTNTQNHWRGIMDIITHAIIGAAYGAKFGSPIAGAVAGVLPDAVLGLKRKAAPTHSYNLTHSLAGLCGATIATNLLFPQYAWAVFFGWFLHIVLDMFTHGDKWAPPLLYPFTKTRYSITGKEWEFGNNSFYFGLLIAIGLLCLALL